MLNFSQSINQVPVGSAMQLMTALALVGVLPTPVLADVYPGDTAYSIIVQEVYHSVTSDKLNNNKMRKWKKKDIHNRPQLCQELVKRQNTIAPASGMTNAAFLGASITVNDCLNALYYSKGYKDSSGWQAWAGNYSGKWFNDKTMGESDSATWESTTKKRTQPQDHDLDRLGRPRIYDFQKVIFHDVRRPVSAKYGWNQSHPDVAYVWGWDPKDASNNNGQTGTHVGFTFEKGKSDCIVWVTPEEAFLECVSDKRRTSTGFWGVGQWSIK